MIARKLVDRLLVCCMVTSILLAGCGSITDSETNAATKYPARPITMIVPISAGGAPDMMVRAMEMAAMKHLGQPLVIRNVPGAAATKSWNELAGAQPDGYTIGVITTGLILQPLYGPTRYHYPTALDPLVQVATRPIVAAVRADQPWESIDEVVQYAKKHPGTIKFGHTGLGAPRHVVGEMFAKAAGIQISQVPFDGEQECLAALLGGHIQLIFIDASVIQDHVKSGSIKVLAVAAEQRLTDPMFKHVPTFREQGLEVVFDLWYGIGAPKRLPQDVKSRLSAGFKEIIHDPEFQRNMANMGMTVDYLGPQEFSEKWLTEYARLTKFIKETGIAERVAEQKN